MTAAQSGQDLKQFAQIQMNMGREVCRRLREANIRLFNAKMGTPKADIGHVSLAHQKSLAIVSSWPLIESTGFD